MVTVKHNLTFIVFFLFQNQKHPVIKNENLLNKLNCIIVT